MNRANHESQNVAKAKLTGSAELRAAAIGHPLELLRRRDFTVDEKRAILASWASDVRSLDHAPNLRQLDSGALVPVADILSALRSLDMPERCEPNRKTIGNLLIFRKRPRRDDDDDPPPAPAMALPLPRQPSGGEAAALADCA